jgi:hypothetical protein
MTYRMGNVVLMKNTQRRGLKKVRSNYVYATKGQKWTMRNFKTKERKKRELCLGLPLVHPSFCHGYYRSGSMYAWPLIWLDMHYR